MEILKRESYEAVSYEALFAATLDIIKKTDPETGFVETDKLCSLLEEYQASFAEEMTCLEQYKELFFGPDVSAYGESVAELFMAWESDKETISCMSLVIMALKEFGIRFESAEGRSVFVSSVLAEFPNDLQYHGNLHYRKVLAHTIRLISLHNKLFPQGEERHMPGKDIASLLAASCIHDLGHEGGDNFRDGVYTPGYMEQKAMDIARPYLEAAGIDDDSYADIQTMVFSTDITLFAGDNSPCARLKKIYKNIYWDSGEDVSLMMMGRMRRYAEKPALVQMAMILHEADIGSSAGLSYEQTIQETINIMEERGLKTAGPKTVLAFLREQLGQTMFTEAGKQLFGPVMEKVIHRAEQENLAGRETFYDPA